MKSFANLKKHIPLRKYRERAQPEARSHLGMLEKKKDYVHRAKVFHKKEDQLNKLRLKSDLRNQDEFYFKMQKSKMEDGKHVYYESDDSDFDEETYKKIIKTQNQNIVKLQLLKDSKKIKKMKENLQLISAPRQNKQKFFTDDQEKAQNFDYEKELNISNGNLHQSIEQLKRQDLRQNEEFSRITSGKLKNNYNKLAETLENKHKMEQMYLKLDYEKKLLGKQKIMNQDSKKQQVKFFKERKR